ncbi:MAG TPA: ABC transporter ATP-binding protein [Terriglobales bacterium]|nr:ABC transporter ATP-binding protein [Terriglobales bacterium]
MLERLRPLFPYLLRYRRDLGFGMLSMLCMNGIWILFPLVIGEAIDGLKVAVTREQLLYYASALLTIAFVKGIFQYLYRWLVIGVSREIEFDLRNDIFHHLETLSHDYYQRTRTGDIMARTTNDLNAVRQMLGPAIMYSASTLVFTAGALAFMFGISPKLTLVAFVPLPMVSILIQYFGRRIHERFERIQATFSDISARAQENFSGARVVRAYVQEEAEIAYFATANREYIARSLKLVQLMGMLWPTLQTLLGFAVVLVLWLGGREVLAGRMTVGQFVAFNTYMVQLTWPIIALGWVINIYQRGTASMGRINEILTETPSISDRDVAPDLAGKMVELRGDIEFRHLNFHFVEQTPDVDGHAARSQAVLRDINLHIPAGSSLAIVGPTGSGKTTLVNLIPRILDAEKGMVFLDGRPIADYPLQTLRRNIGFVPQETFLFSDTVRENIAFGTDSATDGQIRAAADGASIAADIEGFPEGYKTVVGERGITLSGGQKQRTAIARAIIRDPRILILDDALSSVDTYTEERILNHLREVMRGRTTILISHRVSTVRSADKIAVLHEGRIVEYGTHDELIQREGYYTDLYNKQLLEEELAQV